MHETPTRSLALVLAAGTVAALLAQVQRARPRRIDHRGLLALKGRGPDRLRRLATSLDEPAAVVAEAVLVAALRARRSPRVALRIIAAPLLALGVSKLLKVALDRPRPPWRLFTRTGLESFPSSHAAGKGALLWVLARTLPDSRAGSSVASACAGAATCLVGAMRVAEGAHWPTDVVAGAAIGIAAAEAVRVLAGRAERPALP